MITGMVIRGLSFISGIGVGGWFAAAELGEPMHLGLLFLFAALGVSVVINGGEDAA